MGQLRERGVGKKCEREGLAETKVSEGGGGASARAGTHGWSREIFPEGAAACGEDPHWSSEKCEVEGRSSREELLGTDRNAAVSHPPALLRGRGKVEESGVKLCLGRREGGGGGERCSNLSLSLSEPILVVNKLLPFSPGQVPFACGGKC